MIKPLTIGSVTLPNNLILAPMAGVTDLPFRLLCKEQGAGLLCMEMVSAKAIMYKNKNTEELKGMLLNEYDIDFYRDVPINYARGACIVKEYYENNGAMRSRWIVDNTIPVFTKDRGYINQYVYVGGAANEYVDVCERCD